MGRAVASALLQSRVWIEYQAAWKSASGRAGERGGALAGKPRCGRILTITAGSSMAAMILNSPPHCGQCSGIGHFGQAIGEVVAADYGFAGGIGALDQVAVEICCSIIGGNEFGDRRIGAI